MARGGRKPGARPDLWLMGPDPQLRAQRLAWRRAAAQARFRGEQWLVSWEQWLEFWGDDWARRGRGPDQLRMARLDWQQPWQISNMVKLTQLDHNRHSRSQERALGIRS